MSQASDAGVTFGLTSAVLMFMFGFIVLGMWGCPKYKVYSSTMTGKAELAQAEQNRQIEVHKAKAAVDAAVHYADAEVARAHGVAKANKVIGESLKDNESYLRYLWIQGLQDGSSEVIYIPTEANLPILEATRKMQ